MTEWQQECVSELKRQADTYMRVFLSSSQYHCLVDLAAHNRVGWRYSCIQVKNGSYWTYELRPSDARVLLDHIRVEQAAKVTEKLKAAV